MGALYEDVEKFFGDIFAYYGKIVAMFPIAFVVIPVLTCGLLGFGLLNLKYENAVDKLYAPQDSPAMRDRVRLDSIFPEDDENFYPHQIVRLGAFACIITAVTDPSDDTQSDQDEDSFAGSEQKKVLDAGSLREIEVLVNYIASNISVVEGGQILHLSELCARRNNECVIEGREELNHSLSMCQSTTAEPETQSFVTDTTTSTSEEESTEGNIPCGELQALKICFYLRQDSENDRKISKKWETSFLDHMEEYTTLSVDLHVFYTVSDSLDVALYEHAGRDLRLFPATVVTMVILATVLGSGGNWVSTHVLLAQLGVMATLLSILAAFGTLSLAGIPYVDICGLMPFMVFGLGMDHMMLLLTAWRQTHVRTSVQERCSETFRASGTSIIIMSLTDLLVFCIGSTSPFTSIRYFCAFSGVALMFCYINQLTFFGGCLVLNAKRVQNSRHCVTCHPTKSRQEMEDESRTRLQIMFCSGAPARRAADGDNLFRKCPRGMLGKFLLQGGTKVVVLMLYAVYLTLAIMGASRIEVGFRVPDIVPEYSFVSHYMKADWKYFTDKGPTVMLSIDEPIPYELPHIQRRIIRLTEEARTDKYVDGDRHISWLEDYLKYLYANNVTIDPIEVDFYKILKDTFIPSNPLYTYDIIFLNDTYIINTSRFYVFSGKLHNSTSQQELMTNMRSLTHNTSLPLTIYSSEFIFSEHHVSILKDTLLTVTVTIISMLLIALMFIPHPIAVTCVTISMVSVVLGMMGCLYFMTVPLSAIQTVQLLISVGLCLNFTVHLSHSYMTATGKSRNERVSMALEKVGGTLAFGAISMFLGISMLAFASSYLFVSFFRCMSIIIIISLLHAMVLLPVFLTFIGPRRTNKPRVFLPMSTSCRSINTDYQSAAFSTPSTKTEKSDTESMRQTPETTSATGNVSIEVSPSASDADKNHNIGCIEEEKEEELNKMKEEEDRASSSSTPPPSYTPPPPPLSPPFPIRSLSASQLRQLRV